MQRSALLILSSALLALACGDDGGSATGSGTDSGDSVVDDDDGPGTTDETETAETEDSATSIGDTTGSPTEEDVPARGVTIARVEANPGVAVTIVENGTWIEGPDRNGQIPKNRNTAFRVYVDVDDAAWVERAIEGRMTLIQADGTEKIYTEVADIAMDSSESSLQSNILFGVLAEDMQPGVRFNIELFEAGGDYQSLPAVDAPPTALPEVDFIGVEGTYQNMRIMLVPIEYEFGGCSTQFDISEENLAEYESAMFQQNGLENIEIEIHPYYRVDDLDLGGNGFFTLLTRIAQLRASEAPDPNVYYYGLFDNCGACIGDSQGCTLGVANGIPGSSMGEAGARAAIGAQFLGSNEIGIETFVHEIGHSQGRRHIFCPDAQAAGTDPSYPHLDGKTGTWGFGVRDFQIRNSNTHFDYMSYCNPTWVSDWQWRETFERIRELTSWESADGVDPMQGQYVLMGSVNTETGESHWWTDRGWVEDADRKADHSVRFMLGDDVLSESTQVDVDPWSEGSWVSVRAPLPEDFEVVTAIELAAPTFAAVAPRTEIALHHLQSLQVPQ